MLLTVYCVRRDLSEVTFSLQVDADFELHNFRALCELESGIPAAESQVRQGQRAGPPAAAAGELGGGATGAESCSRPEMHPLQRRGHVHGWVPLPTFWPSGALDPHHVPPASPTRNTSLDHWEIDTGLGFAYLYRVPPSVCAVYLGTHISGVESEGKSLRLALPLPLTSLEMHAFLVNLLLFFKAVVRSTQSAS